MKVLVMSDSHGRDSNVMEALEREMPFDVLIHLGDTQEDEEEFCMCVAGEDIPVYLVSGNCDLFADYPPARIVTLAGHRLLLAHGHTHYVNYGTHDASCPCAGVHGAAEKERRFPAFFSLRDRPLRAYAQTGD